MPYTYIWMTKFLYSVFNGPQFPLVMALCIKYYSAIQREDLILLATASISMLRYLDNALGGTYVGYIMEDVSQFNSILVEISTQIAATISFISAFALWWLISVKKGIQIREK